jgi:hypothetical protein
MRIRITAVVSALLLLLILARPGWLDSLGRGDESLDPCRSPLAWHVTTVDPEFGFSIEDVERATRDAARVWEEAAGRDLFRHDTAGMAIRMVYDERQRYHERRVSGEAELDRLAGQVRELESLLRAREVRAENARRDHDRHGTRTTAEEYRRAVERFNGAVERYNEVFASLEALGPAEVRAGDLRSETRTLGGRTVATDRTLTIAVAGDYGELVVVLAHELGHALGLEHVDDPAALMAAQYRQDDAGLPVVLAPADLRALEARCR